MTIDMPFYPVVDLTALDDGPSPDQASSSSRKSEILYERFGSTTSRPRASVRQPGTSENPILVEPSTVSDHELPFTPNRTRKTPTGIRRASDPRHNRDQRRKARSSLQKSPLRFRALAPTSRSISDDSALDTSFGSKTEAEPSHRVFYTPPQNMDPAKAHRELREKIRERLTPKMLEKIEGRLYIARDPAHPHLLKIGSTEETARRARQLEGNCNSATEMIYESPNAFTYYVRAEALAQRDLIHLQRRYRCKCTVSHTDRFEACLEQVKKILKRWENFVKQQPYDTTGQLKAIWNHLISKRDMDFSDRDDYDHEVRSNHWEKILVPPTWNDHWDHLFPIFINHRFWNFLLQFSWQVSSVSSWIVTLCVWYNRFTLSVLLMSMVCAGWSISSEMRLVSGSSAVRGSAGRSKSS